MLPRSLDEQDEIAVYERYNRGEIGEDVARGLLDEKIDQMEADKDAFKFVMQCDTLDFLADSDGECTTLFNSS